MGDALAIAVSGLNAASQRMDAAAGNIANAQDTASLTPQPGQPKPYQPVDVVQTASPTGGTIASYHPVTPASNAIFEPNSPFADSNGLVAAPNVDLAQQLVDTIVARISYDANAKVMQAAAHQQGYLLNIFT